MDPSWSQRSVLICFFRIFARMKKIQKAMTHGTLGTGQRFTPKKTEGSCNLL